MNRFEIMMEILEPIKDDIISVSVNPRCKGMSVCVATVDALFALCREVETHIVRTENPAGYYLKYRYVVTMGNITCYAFSDE